MVQWQEGRCLDPAVWNHLRPKLNIILMPPISVEQPGHTRMPNVRKLHLEDSVRVKVLYFNDVIVNIIHVILIL